jgi:hypothetical protein
MAHKHDSLIVDSEGRAWLQTIDNKGVKRASYLGYVDTEVLRAFALAKGIRFSVVLAR